MLNDGLVRCAWVEDHPLSIAYHDTEWGVPLYDDHRLFEFLVLESMQAGLSWMTVLKKRDAFRQALDDFNAEKIARYSEQRQRQLLLNKAIIRNRLKIQSVVTNARCLLAMQEQQSLSDFLWGFVDGEPIMNTWKHASEIPASTPLSQALSKALKAQGFRFVGPTICYALMQATGLVNDHLVGCFCRQS